MHSRFDLAPAAAARTLPGPRRSQVGPVPDHRFGLLQLACNIIRLRRLRTSF
ncbi:hypothetical protein [Streptomyces sp. C10]|uniref:hypothetical protein n=1 Tax=Streptomyces sp. C10 TaxID=531941 RepID=UPI00397EB452